MRSPKRARGRQTAWEAHGSGQPRPHIDLTCGLIAQITADWDLPENRGCSRYLPLGGSVLDANFPTSPTVRSTRPPRKHGDPQAQRKGSSVAALYSEEYDAAELPPGSQHGRATRPPASRRAASTASCSPAQRVGKSLGGDTPDPFQTRQPRDGWKNAALASRRRLELTAKAIAAFVRSALHRDGQAYVPIAPRRPRRCSKGPGTCGSPAQRPCLYGADHRPATKARLLRSTSRRSAGVETLYEGAT